MFSTQGQNSTTGWAFLRLGYGWLLRYFGQRLGYVGNSNFRNVELTLIQDMLLEERFGLLALKKKVVSGEKAAAMDD